MRWQEGARGAEHWGAPGGRGSTGAAGPGRRPAPCAGAPGCSAAPGSPLPCRRPPTGGATFPCLHAYALSDVGPMSSHAPLHFPTLARQRDEYLSCTCSGRAALFTTVGFTQHGCFVKQSRVRAIGAVCGVSGPVGTGYGVRTLKAGFLPVMVANRAARAATTVSILTSRWSAPTCATQAPLSVVTCEG